ncbi:melanoma-associated antigen 10 [Phodopus roborovskii]|uniref:Magea4 protein n=1 Tax=Phodopus roborovskii TaxID=109678 RepID=A0AAU9YWW9_PHORO|nr:melanoma-associated antigen 10 [Phodopus roborovskii]CAH6779823.1 Magea4 [Phodopus roborovskii]
MDDCHNIHIHHCNLLASPPSQREVDNAQVFMVVAKDEEAITTTSKNIYDSGTPGSPQRPQRACSPFMVMGPITECPSDEASGNQIEELEEPMPLLHNTLNIKVFDLVHFLLFKYEMKAFTTKSEMLESIVREYEEYHPVIFSEASECLRLVFGIGIIEMDPFVQSYILVTALGITYEGILSDAQGKSKTGLLIVILGVIFLQGNCVSEEMIWRMLNNIGFCDWRNPFLYENPRKLITEHFVQEGYLEYRQVPDSYPPSHEFLWGPRAFAETTKVKILEFFASITKSNPRFYSEKYAEALWDELHRA